MSKKRFCPECGLEVEADERFCRECGVEIPRDPEEHADTVTDTPGGMKPSASDASIIGAGARANVTGGINKTSTSHTNINTSRVDNSSTVHNNTTIVMGKDSTEYCEVCGNPFGEKHARCPKCGKQICFDCKVKGKNRCVECEKKSVNEYRLAFQQLLLTTNGNIGIAGRQMMDQKARDQDVEDVKAQVEKELTELYKPINKVVSPPVASPVSAPPTREPASPARPSVASSEIGGKGVGSIAGGKPVKPVRPGTKTNKWIPVVAVMGCLVVAFFLFGKKDNTAKVMPPATPVEQKQAVADPAPPAKEPKATSTVATPQKTEKQAEVKQTVEKEVPPPVVKPDADYDAGMVAYDKKDGLEAVRHFNKSGSASSLYMLGLIYEKGCGRVAANAMMARKNFKKAADMGNEDAKAKLK